MRTLDAHYFVSDDGKVNIIVVEKFKGDKDYGMRVYHNNQKVDEYKFKHDELFDMLRMAWDYIRAYERGERK